MKQIELTVDPDKRRNDPNCRYRFRIPAKHRHHFPQNLKKVKVTLGDLLVDASIVCQNHYPEIQDSEIDSWIREKGFHLYTKGNPPKLSFTICQTKGTLEIQHCKN